MSHTPGPWRIECDGDTRYSDWNMVGADGTSLMCNTQYYPWTPTKDEDWHLIVAAPELLAALKLLVEDREADGYGSEEPALTAKLAIAKAEGGAK
jgi:hypothetical protein